MHKEEGRTVERLLRPGPDFVIARFSVSSVTV